jgi:hypothetical protein
MVQPTRKAINAGTDGSTFLEHLDAIGGEGNGICGQCYFCLSLCLARSNWRRFHR